MKTEAYGTWIVTTEGDCEGRSTRQLGTHTGYFDEIAFALAKQAYYGLRFDAVDPLRLKKAPPTATSVQVSMGIETGSWDMTPKARVQHFREMLAGRDVIVKEGTYYACVELVSGMSAEAQEEARVRVLAESARSKLSDEELKALLGAKS